MKPGEWSNFLGFRGISLIYRGRRDWPRCRSSETPGSTFQWHSVEYHQPLWDSSQGSWWNRMANGKSDRGRIFDIGYRSDRRDERAWICSVSVLHEVDGPSLTSCFEPLMRVRSLVWMKWLPKMLVWLGLCPILRADLNGLALSKWMRLESCRSSFESGVLKILITCYREIKRFLLLHRFAEWLGNFSDRHFMNNEREFLVPCRFHLFVKLNKSVESRRVTIWMLPSLGYQLTPADGMHWFLVDLLVLHTNSSLFPPPDLPTPIVWGGWTTTWAPVWIQTNMEYIHYSRNEKLFLCLYQNASISLSSITAVLSPMLFLSRFISDMWRRTLSRGIALLTSWHTMTRRKDSRKDWLSHLTITEMLPRLLRDSRRLKLERRLVLSHNSNYMADAPLPCW
jgi:hypothetical protein